MPFPKLPSGASASNAASLRTRAPHALGAHAMAQPLAIFKNQPGQRTGGLTALTSVQLVNAVAQPLKQTLTSIVA